MKPYKITDFTQHTDDPTSYDGTVVVGGEELSVDIILEDEGETEKIEQQMNTCICKGVAVPHAVCDSASGAVVALGISRKGVDYGIDFDSELSSPVAFNDSLVHIVIMMLGGREHTSGRLNILTSCADILRKPGFCSDIMTAKTADDVLRTICTYENDC